MEKTSNARFLGHLIDGALYPVTETESGYTEKEETCKGCMGPCGQCDDGDAPEPDPEKKLPVPDWSSQKTIYDLS